MAVNDFLPFCPTDTGTNLLSESAYTASADRTSGSKPGIASSALNNKALRQGTYITSQLAQFISNTTQTDVLDDATPAKLLAQINMSLKPIAPIVTALLTGTGTFHRTFIFGIASGSATVGATYTNNSFTFTVSSTVSSSVQLVTTGTGVPTTSGTLTKASGTGDATITFYALKQAIYLKTKLVGGGGGGLGGGSGASAGTSGGDTTVGTSFLTAGGGAFSPTSAQGGAGGSSSVVSPAIPILSLSGGSGNGGGNQASTNVVLIGGGGAASPFGGAGGGGAQQANGQSAIDNTGSGGGGGGATVTASAIITGGGGGAGGYIEAQINSPNATYIYGVGAGGTGGAGATTGGGGGKGIIIFEEIFQ